MQLSAFSFPLNRLGIVSVGNRLSLTTTAGVVNCQYDAASRLVLSEVEGLTSVNGQAYTWDDNGNLLNDGVRSYTYTHANRLTQVVSGTLTTEFAYNGAGDRVARTVDGVTTSYVLDPTAGLTQVLVESTGGESTSYLYGHDGSTALTTGLLAQYDSGTWAYHLNDGLGSVRQLADPAGQVVASYSFSPFGVPLGESGGEPYGFTGEQWDASAGLVYLRARYYSPQTGRFITEDPAPGYARVPKSLHVYVYAWNKPTLLTDPRGQQVPPEECQPGEICAGGTTGPYVVSVPPPPTQPIEPSPPSPPVSDPYQAVICARPPMWFALHYHKRGYIHLRHEVFPGATEYEIPTPVEGVLYTGQAGFRHVTIYDLRLSPLDEYWEFVTAHGLGAGLPEADLAGALEITDRDIGPEFSAEFLIIEIEVQVGVEEIQGTVYFKSPGGAVHKAGYGLDVALSVDRWLLAFEEDVYAAGGYEAYGWRRIGESYEFEGVVMRAFDKGTIEAWWYMHHRTEIPNQPEVPKLEEFR